MDQREPREAFAESAFSGLAAPLVDEAIEQANAVASAPSPEGLHQFRLTMRHLRSLWWSYRPLLDVGENTRQRGLFKSLADAAAKARNYDVLIALLNLQCRDARERPQGTLKAQQAALNAGCDVLSSPEMKILLLKALSQTSKALVARRDRQSLQAFPETRVAGSGKWLSKRMKLAGRAKRSDVSAFHDVRKGGRKARYLLELFGPVLSGGHQKTLNRLKKMQKRCCSLNNIVASEMLLRDNSTLLAVIGEPKRALEWLKKKRKRHMRAAAALLRKDGK